MAEHRLKSIIRPVWVAIYLCLSGCLGGEETLWHSPSLVVVSENTSGSFYSIKAVDAASGNNIVKFSLAGVDADLFVLDETGKGLMFSSLPDYESPADDNNDNVYTLTILAQNPDGSLRAGGQELLVNVTDMAAVSNVDRLFPLRDGLFHAGSQGVWPLLDIASCNIQFRFGDYVEGANYNRKRVYSESLHPVDRRDEYINGALITTTRQYSDSFSEQETKICSESSWLDGVGYFALPDSFYTTDHRYQVDLFHTGESTYEFQYDTSDVLPEIPVVKTFNPNNIFERDFNVGLWNDETIWVMDKRINKVTAKMALPNYEMVEHLDFADDGSILLVTSRVQEHSVFHDVYQFKESNQYVAQKLMSDLVIDGIVPLVSNQNLIVFEENGAIKVSGAVWGGCAEDNSGQQVGLRYFTVEDQATIHYLDEGDFVCSASGELSSILGSAPSKPPYMPIIAASNDRGIWYSLLTINEMDCFFCTSGEVNVAKTSSDDQYRFTMQFDLINEGAYSAIDMMRFTCLDSRDPCYFPEKIFYLDYAGIIYTSKFNDVWGGSSSTRLSGKDFKASSIDLDEQNNLLYALGIYGDSETPVFAVIHYVTGAASYLPLAMLISE